MNLPSKYGLRSVTTGSQPAEQTAPGSLPPILLSSFPSAPASGHGRGGPAHVAAANLLGPSAAAPGEQRVETETAARRAAGAGSGVGARGRQPGRRVCADDRVHPDGRLDTHP